MSVEKIYWDSDCIIAYLQNEAGKADQCSYLLERADRGEVIVITSTLAIAEVLWMRGGPKIGREKAEIVNKFFRRSIFRVVDVTRKIAERAQLLVWENDIRPKDAIHVATALQSGVLFLETFDASLIKRSGSVGEKPLLIREPVPAREPRLPFPSRGVGQAIN